MTTQPTLLSLSSILPSSSSQCAVIPARKKIGVDVKIWYQFLLSVLLNRISREVSVFVDAECKTDWASGDAVDLFGIRTVFES